MGGFFCFVFVQDFFFKAKSKLHGIIASISLNKGANKSTLPKNSLYTSLKPVFKCKQFDNNNIKIFLKDQNSQKTKQNKTKQNKTYFGILKIRCGIHLYSKNLFPVFKNKWRAMEDNQTTFFFFFFSLRKNRIYNATDQLNDVNRGECT